MNARRAVAGDVGTVRALRLQALGGEPYAFGSTLERERAQVDEDWRRWIATGATFIVDGAAGPDGLVAARCDEDEESVVHLMAMWVHPESRGSGAGDALVRAVVEWAETQGARAVRLL